MLVYVNTESVMWISTWWFMLLPVSMSLYGGSEDVEGKEWSFSWEGSVLTRCGVADDFDPCE